MRIKFLRRVQYESEGRGKGPVYDKGSEHDFDDGFAQRWLRRGVAVVATEAPAPVEPAEVLGNETPAPVVGNTDPAAFRSRPRGR